MVDWIGSFFLGLLARRTSAHCLTASFQSLSIISLRVSFFSITFYCILESSVIGYLEWSEASSENKKIRIKKGVSFPVLNKRGFSKAYVEFGSESESST